MQLYFINKIKIKTFTALFRIALNFTAPIKRFTNKKYSTTDHISTTAFLLYAKFENNKNFFNADAIFIAKNANLIYVFFSIFFGLLEQF